MFAAYVAYTDHEIGRVIQAVEDMGKLDNTLIIYINGDNGTSAEGTPIGTPNEVAIVQRRRTRRSRSSSRLLRRLGHGQDLQPHGRAMDVDVRLPVLVDQADRLALRRHAAGHGDLVAEGIKDKGGHPPPVPPRHRHRADDPGGDAASQQPDIVDGIKQSPIEGVSMAYTFDAKNAECPSTHKTQYFEMMGNRAIYHDGWIAGTKVMRAAVGSLRAQAKESPLDYPWELYDLTKDWTQADDVAAKNPAKLKELQDLFWKEAEKYQVAAARRLGSRRG